MIFYIKYPITLVLLILLFACNNNHNNMENTGELPKLDRTNTLTGIDADNNAIRDDIDAYIAQHYTNPVEKKAVGQLAKALQKAILVGATADDEARRIEAKKVSLKVAKGIDCIFYTNTINPSFDVNIVYQMESLMTNTKERLMAYLTFDKALDGTASKLVNGKETCDE